MGGCCPCEKFNLYGGNGAESWTAKFSDKYGVKSTICVLLLRRYTLHSSIHKVILLILERY